MTTAPLTIVPMTRGHVQQVMRLDALVYPEPWSKRLWMLELGRDQRLYRCAVRDRQVVGYVGAVLVLEDAHILNIVTDPDQQRQGIATRLLLDVVRGAIDAGSEALTLEVRATNLGAQALYRRFGLAPVGWRRDYYAPDGEDAVVMWAHDIHRDEYGRRLDRIAADLEVTV